MRATTYGKRALLVPLLALALTACDGDGGAGIATAGGAGAATTTSAAPVDPEEAGRKFAQCMRDNGIDMPDPEPGMGPRFQLRNGDQAKMRAAMEKCRDLLPNGGERMRAPSAEEVEQMREYAKCMRANGLPDFPDPDSEGRLRLTPGDVAVGPDDPKFRAAEKACEDKSPRRERRP